MKPLLLLFLFFAFNAHAQSCDELMEYVKSKDRGTTYTSYTSEAIQKVTFYEVYVDYRTLYFVVVCFKQKYSYSCSEYIYQVGSMTKFNYSMDYFDSAGKAFWEHIQPYNSVLKCAPDFD